LLAIIADEKDDRLPVDARASLIVLAAQLQALQTMRPFLGSALWGRARSPLRSRIRAHSGRGVILPPGLGSYHDKIQPGVNRS
jgi:hypothetical protein